MRTTLITWLWTTAILRCLPLVLLMGVNGKLPAQNYDVNKLLYNECIYVCLSVFPLLLPCRVLMTEWNLLPSNSVHRYLRSFWRILFYASWSLVEQSSRFGFQHTFAISSTSSDSFNGNYNLFLFYNLGLCTQRVITTCIIASLWFIMDRDNQLSRGSKILNITDHSMRQVNAFRIIMWIYSNKWPFYFWLNIYIFIYIYFIYLGVSCKLLMHSFLNHHRGFHFVDLFF